MEVIGIFGMALLLTCIVETMIAFWWGVRDVKGYQLILLVNLLTNPLANLVYWIGRTYCFSGGHIVLWGCIELAVWVTESSIYQMFPDWIRRPWLFAAFSNAASIAFGIVLETEMGL